MKTAGIIAEYNPFHKGHEYHIQRTRELTEAEGIIAVISGNFVQRGDAALCDKHSRAEMALSGGADLVIELPCVFACQSAEYFAKGGVGLLEALNCNYISFGMENENLDELIYVGNLLNNPDEEFKNKLTDALKSGISYPRALSDILDTDVVNTPNNVLAIEYLRANKSMTPVGIKRKGSTHDGEGSASDIREKIKNQQDADYLMPAYSSEILKRAEKADRKILENLILYKLRTMGVEEIKNIPDVSEGLEHRIKSAAAVSTTVDELCSIIKTKRYTMARIRRIIINALLGISKKDILQKPQYIRILGMNKTGMKILSALRGNTDIPVITKTADATPCSMLEIDIMASDIYSLLTGNTGMSDYKKSPVIK